MLSYRKFGLFSVIYISMLSSLFGTDYTWRGGAEGLFEDQANWLPFTVPGPGDTITFNNPSNVILIMRGGGTVSKVSTAANVHLLLVGSGALTVTSPASNTFSLADRSNIQSATAGFNLNSPNNYTADILSVNGSSTLTFVNSSATSDGTLTVTNTGGAQDSVLSFGNLSTGQAGLSNWNMPVIVDNDLVVVVMATPFPASLTNNSNSLGLFDGVSSGVTTYSQTITGSASWVVQGQVEFTGIKSYTGTTQVNNALTLSTTLPNSAVTVAIGGILQGTGSMGSTLAINGTCITGLTETPGTLTVSGAVTMGSTGTLTIPVTPTANGLLSIDQNVALNLSGNGTLNISYRPGVHEQGSFTVVSSQGAITGQFGSFTHNAADDVTLALTYNATAPGSIVVTQSGRHIVHPTPISGLQGNDRIMGDYLYGDSNFVFANRDLVNISQFILVESPFGFREALVRLSPLATAGTPLLSLQNNLQMAVVLDKQYQDTQAKSRIQTQQNASDPCKTPLYATPNTGFFIEPIFIFVDQRQVDGSITNLGQVPYKAYTYGAGGGWEKVWNDCLVLELGAGYTHSNLNWSQNFGNARWSTVYLAPFMGWFNRKAYGNGMIMGAANFHWNNRIIEFPGFRRQAHSTYQSYDILLRLNGGFRQYLGKEWWFQPDGTLNYLTALTSAYTETGAQSINLSVRSRQSYILQPSLRAMFIRELFRGEWYYAPKLYVGWLANVFLKRDNITARFNGAPDQSLFTIQGYYKTINQLVLGAEMYTLKSGKFNCTTSFEADVLSKLGVYTAKVKLEWLY